MMIKLKASTLLIAFPAICLLTIIIYHTHHIGGENGKDYLWATAYPNITEELSTDGKFGRKYFVWTGESWPSTDINTSVCLATQGSPNYLHWVELHARLWKGPISVGVYAPGLNFMAAYNRITYLRKCYAAVRDLVSFHVVFPQEHPPLFTKEDIVDVDCTSADVAEVFNSVLAANFSKITTLHYPQNHLRNTARNACPTSYSMTVDIDMIPWEGMSKQMDIFFSDIEFLNCAYVVPVYEIHSAVKKFPPTGKKQLRSLLNDGKARIFHSAVFKPNQLNSNLDRWEKTNLTTEPKIDISFRVTKYMEFWEPILVLHSSAPDFFERFIGYGFTRNTHVFLLNLLSYHFIVLENAFLSHLGFQESSIYNNKRKKELNNNSKLYTKFKTEMAKKYDKYTDV